MFALLLYFRIFSKNRLITERITLFAYCDCSLLFEMVTSINRGSMCQLVLPWPKKSNFSYQICSKKAPLTKCSDILHVGFLFDQFEHPADGWMDRWAVVEAWCISRRSSSSIYLSLMTGSYTICFIHLPGSAWSYRPLPLPAKKNTVAPWTLDCLEEVRRWEESVQ